MTYPKIILTLYGIVIKYCKGVINMLVYLGKSLAYAFYYIMVGSIAPCILIMLPVFLYEMKSKKYNLKIIYSASIFSVILANFITDYLFFYKGLKLSTMISQIIENIFISIFWTFAVWGLLSVIGLFVKWFENKFSHYIEIKKSLYDDLLQFVKTHQVIIILIIYISFYGNIIL